ncbi:MAG: alkaline phosphatase family protein [Planctomycetes bacterium]|nr:alkaline phosphatase family protein [Planctomycetota bacterium]
MRLAAPALPVTLRAAVAAWTAPFAATAIAFGTLLVYRNADAGIPWTSPAVFCGAPALALMAVGAAAGFLLYLILQLAAPAANRIVAHALPAAFFAGSLAGYHSIREYELDAEWRWLGGIGCGAVFVMIAWLVARTAAARIVATALTALGGIAILLFAASLVTIYLPTADASDPRDALPKVEAVKSPPKPDATAGRVLLLGVDGVTWDIIDPLIAKGQLPNFARLRKDGATARLRTFVPTASPLIWTTIATGRLPIEHGIGDFIVRSTKFLPTYSLELQNRPLRAMLSLFDLYAVSLVTSNLRTSKAIWNIASEVGLKISVVGWWATFPAEDINGWIVSDAASGEWVRRLMGRNEKLKNRTRGTTFPEPLAAELAPLRREPSSITKDELARFIQMDDSAWSDFENARKIDKEQPLSVLHSAYLRDEFYVASSLKIDAGKKPDIVFCYTRLTDDFEHFFWEYSEPEAAELGKDPKLVARYKDTVAKAHVWADGIVGKFMERLGPKDVLIVLSDHGFERMSRGMYNHNNGPDGILAFYGGSVKHGFEFKEKPHVLDIGPTILYLAGIPKGADMAGRALREAFTLERAERTLPTWETARVGGRGIIDMFDADEKMRQLEQNGYLQKRK